MDAPTRKNVAEEKSPGTAMSVPVSLPPPVRQIVEPDTVTL